ncbi:cytochrome p450-like protein [Trypanosoma grayi]|uniref:cytochrome p450-like protein n=1 Tax=Trypanosoma grayi TaxID=71804 RepID=UPI0004F47026|nr:cytochrome p450-like protein [Trypanosoma grayi]KEG15311.1 cytochrome p450-like protein [Trypanosoma grayi]
MRSGTVTVLSAIATTTFAVSCGLRILWCGLSSPPGIPSPPIPPHDGDGVVNRYIKRFFLQHLYVLRKGESLFRLLEWARLFHHKPFATRIFFRSHIVISSAADLEEVLLRQEDSFCKRTGYDLLRLIIGDGLLAMGGKKKHAVHRRIFSEVFHSANIKGLANEVMRLHVLRLLGTFFELVLRAGDGVVTINIGDYTRRMALSIVGDAAFRASREDSEAALEAFATLSKYENMSFFCPYYRTRPQKEAEKVLMDLSNALLQNANDGICSQRRVVLDALIDQFYVQFNRNDVVNHLITFLFAGHDTTSNTLHFLFALVARDARVQQRLYDELEMIMPGLCTCPTVEELLECEYLVAVVREVMRLFPAAPLIYRDAEKDVILPASGVMVPKGSVCMLSIFSVHRCEEIYGKDVDEFRPERWLGEEGRALRDRCGLCGYLPFSTGRRNCIGKEYAHYEVLLTAAVVLRHLRLEAIGPFPRARFWFTISSPDPCRVKLIRRECISCTCMAKNVRRLQGYGTAEVPASICSDAVGHALE